MITYHHKVQYYETDRMGVTHHSNYIRWMEEARIDYLMQIGWPYEKLEEIGIVSPVTNITCKYKVSTTFADDISIEASVKSFNGLLLKIGYIMRKEDQIVCEAESEHVFLNSKGMFIRMNREYPELYQCLVQLSESHN